MIVVYTSSHGWGHNVRMVSILNELYNYQLEVVTTAPDWLIRTSLHNKRSKPLTIRTLLTDPGCVQFDPFTINIEKSIEAWKNNFSDLDKKLQEEVSLLKSKGIPVRLVLSDISFFGQLVAESLNVPSVCIATFDWAFIYQIHVNSDPELKEIIQKVQDISKRFDYCLIPGTVCRPLEIGKKQIEFNWASRKPTISRPDIREKLGLSLVLDSVLLSFGGFAIKNLPAHAWKKFNNFEFFVLLPKKDCVNPHASNVHFLASEDWSGMHVDLVDTVDVVIGKCGYGLCSEILHTKKPFLAVDRKGNPEIGVIKKYMKKTIPYREITEEQFNNGEWYALNELVEMKVNELDYEKCEVNGEKQIASWIRKLLGDREPIHINKNMISFFVLILAIFVWFFLKKT
ncbi:hypothetical protein TRFO_13497 [Tritrichomonas foetus]|uniref:Glycosyl transferase family 28 C-terminal domain-containing protein n=1 Tax=Tritrichomonas foetus TaxID=1144522 RepID=A0A1J4KYR1_9EUKA|nr:hypothetical protein TRFO_13497 [Tritrichomonas foetus]|eukprot:OHT16016.1 hypothetical protein TRFO_13497 [Tritrichomonas foetus]